MTEVQVAYYDMIVFGTPMPPHLIEKMREELQMDLDEDSNLDITDDRELDP